MASSLTSIKVDPLLLTKLLRKAVIDRTVVVLKGVFCTLALLFVVLLVREAITNHLKLQTDLAELQKVHDLPLDSDESGHSSTDYSLLSRQPLIAIDVAPKEPTKAPPKVSTVALSLIGTFITGARDPYAIIEDKKKNIQEVFNIGETIFGEAKLKSIHSDHVEIERNGQLEKLVLDDLIDSKPDFKGGVAAMENNLYVVDETELDKALENLPLLLTQARAVPYFKDGVAIGLRLFAIKNDSIYEKIGLKNGDILKSVNGNSLGDLTQAMKLFETLKQERGLGLKLERNMEEKDFKYEIK